MMTDTIPEITALNVPALSNWPNVEIAQTGQWDISTGRVTLTAADFGNAVAALDCPAVRRPVLKLGHDEPMPDAQQMRWDGEPAIGYVDNMALAEDGGTIVGDFSGMPGWLGPILPSAYPDRSMEATWDFTCQLGHLHPFVITAVALLGVTPPGIGTLGSLQDVANLYGIAATTRAQTGGGFSVKIHASKGASDMPNPRPKEIAAGVTTEDVRRQFYDSGVAYSLWIKEFQLDPPELITIDEATGAYARVPVSVENGVIVFGDAVPVEVTYVDQPQETAAASAAKLVYASKDESRVTAPARRSEPELTLVEAIKRVHKAATGNGSGTEEGSTEMDSDKIRKALGLPEGATDEQIIDAATALAASGAPAPAPAPADPAPAPVPAVAAGNGVMVVDRSVIEALKEQASRGEAAFKMMQKQSRDRVIGDAIQAGKFAPVRREEFERLFDADPDGTEALIKSLSPGLVPLQAAGYAGAAETAEQDAEYFRLFPEEKKAV